MYFSEVEPGCVKAWKCHTRQTQRFAVPVGQLKIVLYDDRPESPTRGRIMEVLLGRPDNYALLQIPPRVWYGFTAAGSVPAVICNCPDIRTIRRKGSVRTSIRGISPIIGNTSGQGFPAPFSGRPPRGADLCARRTAGQGGNPRRLT